MIQVIDSLGQLKVTGAGGGGGGATGSISAGTTNASLGQVVFSNSNGVSFGLNGQTVTAQHNGLTSQSNQAFSAQGGSSAFQTLSFNNANGATFSNNGGAIELSYTVPSTAGLLSNIRVSAGTTSNLLSAFTFNNGNGITFGLDASTITASHNGLTTAMASNRGSDFVQATAAFAGTNASGTIASNGISVSVNAQSVVPQNASLFGLGNTTQNSSTQLSLNALSLNAIGSLTVGFSNGSIQFSAPNALTTAMASNASTQFVQANAAFAGTNASGTIASNGISVSVNAGGGGAALKGSGTYTQNTGTIEFANSNGITFGLSNNGTMTASHNGLTTARASTDAIGLNTAQSNVTWTVNSSGLSLDARGYAGTGTTFNGANLSGSMTLNSNGLNLSMSAAVPGGGGAVNFSAGTTSQNLQSVIFANANNMSFGINTNGSSQSITASFNPINIGMSTNGNTAGTTGTFDGAALQYIFAGVSGITLSQSSNASSVTLSIVGDQATFSGYNPYADQVKVAGQVGQGTINIDPVRFDNVVFDRMINNMNFTATSNSSGSMTVSLWNGLYTRNASTLSLLSSFSTSTNVSMSGTVGSYSLFSGIRNISIPASMTITEGDYWLAVVSRTTTGGAAGMTLSQQVASNINSVFAGQFGVAHNTTMQLTLGQGIYSVTSAGLPNSIGFSEIRGSDSGARRAPFILFAYSTV